MILELLGVVQVLGQGGAEAQFQVEGPTLQGPGWTLPQASKQARL